MYKISLSHLLDLVDCGIIFIERRNGTPSNLVDLSAQPSDHTLRALSGKMFDVTGREGVDLLLKERADG